MLSVRADIITWNWRHYWGRVQLDLTCNYNHTSFVLHTYGGVVVVVIVERY